MSENIFSKNTVYRTDSLPANVIADGDAWVTSLLSGIKDHAYNLAVLSDIATKAVVFVEDVEGIDNNQKELLACCAVEATMLDLFGATLWERFLDKEFLEYVLPRLIKNMKALWNRPPPIGILPK